MLASSGPQAMGANVVGYLRTERGVGSPPVRATDAPASRDAGRQHLGLDAATCTYHSVLDRHSHMERKNALAAIDAFKVAFPPPDRARLVIKCVNAGPDELAAMHA